MISRLLLVGMVGVLGISLPDGADQGKSLPPAREVATACACPRETVTFEPIAVDDSTNRIADELNRQSEGVDLPMVAPVRVAAIARPVVVKPIDAVERLFAEDQVWAGPADEAKASDAVDALFAENRIWAGPAGEPIASQEVDTLFADSRVWAEVEDGAPAPDAADRLFAENRVWAEVEDEAVASNVSPAPSTEQRPSFEPIEVADGSSSVVDELYRCSEGLDVAADADAEPPTIVSAVRLTRDAAMAWLNVLTRTVTTTDPPR